MKEAETSTDRRATWDVYTLAWKEKTAQAKLQRLRTSTTETCVYRDPLTHADGQDALVDCMMAFHQQIPGGYFETTYFLAHHDRSISKCNMHPGDGVIVGDGVSYGEYDAQGQLQSMTGFFDTPQP